MQTNKTDHQAPLSLVLTLNPQDAEILRAAIPPGPPARDSLGIKTAAGLAQTALGAVCRALLAQGYQPEPAAAELLEENQTAPLPAGALKIQLR